MKQICAHVSFLMIAFALGLTALAADKRPITAQDLWAFKRLGAPAVSPDGRLVVFTVQEWSVEKNKSTSNLWLAEDRHGQGETADPSQRLRRRPGLESRRSPHRICFEARRGRERRALCDSAGWWRSRKDCGIALERYRAQVDA